MSGEWSCAMCESPLFTMTIEGRTTTTTCRDCGWMSRKTSPSPAPKDWETYEMKDRKPVGAFTARDEAFVVCDDGSVWRARWIGCCIDGWLPDAIIPQYPLTDPLAATPEDGETAE